MISVVLNDKYNKKITKLILTYSFIKCMKTTITISEARNEPERFWSQYTIKAANYKICP